MNTIPSMISANNRVTANLNVPATDDTFMRLITLLGIDRYCRIPTEKFHDLFNIALVAMGVKPAALVRKMYEVDQSAIRTHFNLHVRNVELPTEDDRTFTITWISYHPLDASLTSHTIIGRELGYLRPMDIDTKLARYTRQIGLEISFAGKKELCHYLRKKYQWPRLVMKSPHIYIIILRQFAPLLCRPNTLLMLSI